MLMLSLWQDLRHPSINGHPLFHRIRLEPQPVMRPSVRILIGVGMITGLLLVCGMTYILPPYILQTMVLLPLVLPALYLLMVIGGTGKGVNLAGKISSEISRQYENESVEVLSAQPSGAFGMVWAVILGHLHRASDFELSNELQTQITVGLFMSVSALLLLLHFNTWTDTVQQLALLLTFILYPLVAIYYLDYVSAVLISVVTAALTAQLIARRTESRFVSIVVFLILQLSSYGITYLLATQTLPALFGWMQFDGTLAWLSLSAMSVIVFVLLREAILQIIWRVLLWRLNVQTPAHETIH